MGYLSCNAESSITTCDSYNFDFTHISKKQSTKQEFKIRQFSSTELYSATDNFSEKTLLGKGSHGHVYKAYLDNGKLLAAVKKTKQTEPYFTLNNNTNVLINTPPENEIEVLARVRHPRLVNLLGYAVDLKTNSKLIVVEFMPNGTLHDWLHRSARPPGWARRIRLALQVAKAVHYLHSTNPPVIHRDIKSSNVLIDVDFNARLGDFGLALRGHVEDVRVKCTPPAGTLGYLDPGYLAPGDLSTKLDVFSFGTLLLEIISGRNAIDMNFSPPSVVDWAVPLINSGEFARICDVRIGVLTDMMVLHRLGNLASKCVRPTVAKRPGMGEVMASLNEVYHRVNSPIWNRVGRRVGECARGGNFEMVEESGEILKASTSRRPRKVSSVTSVQIEVENNESGPLKFEKGDRVVRSRSIGSITEVKYGQLDGLGVKRSTSSTVRLSKSRSMGMLQGTILINNNVVKGVKSCTGRKLEKSKLLVDSANETLEEN
ncbi:hypothetical protein Leryth_026273 [Lithospermum erythrorhizon]|nr:hypothetical protein Leryth_026273 [Lithospermum erythrorhizon]